MPITMTSLNKKIEILVAFLAFLLFLSIMQFTSPYIIGFDGYYHIKTASIMRGEGFFEEFPWAEHTILSSDYADIQVLFRILLIPFTFFGLELGAKLAAVLFGAFAFVVFYWFLLENKIRFAFLWTLLYMFSSAALMQRFLLPRQMPLAIALIILTLHFLQKRKYLLLGLTSFAFALLHSSFVIQLFIVILYFILEKLFSKKLDYRLLLYPFAGAIFGLLINPYFPDNIPFLYAQIFQVNLLSNLFNVEWKPWTFFEFLKYNALVLIYIAVTLFIVIKEKKLTKTKTFYLLLTLIFFVYTILSRRMQEYLVPFSILTVSLFLKQYYDRKKLFRNFRIMVVLILVIIVPLNFALMRQELIGNDFLHNFEKCADWMKNNVPENSVVFINAYAFPYLFFKNDGLRYTHGVDLTYSYLHDAEKFERYMGILQGTIRTNIDWIIADYKPDYLLSGKVEQDVKLFEFVLANKENYKPVYEDEWCAVLEVRV
jgi:hypothetical protein